MHTSFIRALIGAGLAIACSTAMASNLKSIENVDHSLLGGTYEEVTGWDFVTNYQVNDQGKNHTCEARWTKDGWATQQVTPAHFVRAADGKEFWRVSVGETWPSTANKTLPKQIKYVFSCTDHSGKHWINSENGWLESYGYTLSDTVQTVPLAIKPIKYY